MKKSILNIATLLCVMLLCKRHGQKAWPESGISEIKRRTPAKRIGGFFVRRHSLTKFLWGLLEGSRKACRYLLNGYSTPDSTPALSSGIETADMETLRGGKYA